ncbi:MAG: hypothetical protein IJ796_03495 [Lachnospiraceae bacterium]|nr:hypothetical protein [Lachnospiraceae bacterium]
MDLKAVKEKLNSFRKAARQIFVMLLALVITINVIPPLSGKLTLKTQAATVYGSVLERILITNLGNAAKYSELTEEDIQSTFKYQLTEGATWSSINIPNFLREVGELIKDGDVNPWLEATPDSENSPYSPGKDFNGNTMNTGYTMGQLMVDYIRANLTEAALLTDAQIVEIYDQLAGTGDEGDPFIDEDTFKESVSGAASSAGIGFSGGNNALPYIDTSDYVTYGEYIRSRNTPIPGGTLFIGTWIIDAQTINDTFYRMANESMAVANQQIKLYKSELAGNRWKDISGAEGLEYILPLAENVEEATLVNYYVSVVVGADGIPRSAKTGQEIDIFNLINPYELEQLPEFKALRMQIESGAGLHPADNSSHAYIMQRVSAFFRYDQPFERNDRMKSDAEYIFDVSRRTGIAFYASDPYTWGGTRYEESGRGFLESMENWAEYSYDKYGVISNINYTLEGNSWWSWFWYGYDTDWQERLIRGSVSWTNEIAWLREVQNFGGYGELRRRIWNFQNLWVHFSCVRDDVTDMYDRQLQGMGNIYSQLRAGGNTEDRELADMALLIQERLDAGRRAEVYYNLVENENHNYVIGPPLLLLYEQIAYGETSVGRNFNVLSRGGTFAAVDGITETVENAIMDCDASYIDYSSLAISEGTTIASKTQYDLENYIIDHAGEGVGAVRQSLRELVDLQNINNNVIAHKTRELNFLTNLLATADVKFQQYVHESAGDTYRAAAADPDTSKETLEEILNDQKAEVSGVAGELQRFIIARAMRLPTEDAIELVHNRLNWAEAQRPGVAADNFGPYAEEVLDEHIKWLKALLSTIKEGGDIVDEGQALANRKAELENALKTALDDDDLALADQLRGEIKDIQEQIDDLNASNNAVLAMDGASAADIAEAEPVGTPQAVANSIVDSALSAIAENNYDGIGDVIGALEALGSPRISEVIEALELHGAPVSIINDAKLAEANIGDSEFSGDYPGGGNGSGGGTTGPAGGDGDGADHGDGDGTGTDYTGDDSGGGRDDIGGGGDGSGGNNSGGGAGDGDIDGDNDNGEGKIRPAPDYGDGTGLTDDDFDNAIEDALGDDFDNLSDFDKAAVVAALTDFADARDDAGAYDYALDLLADLLASGNPFVYRQYLPDQSKEYVSLAAVDNCRRYTRFRLVDKEAQNDGTGEKATMQQFVQGSASYVFEVGSTVVYKNNNETDMMDTAAVSQEDESIRHSKTAKYPYITEDYSGKYLYCTCVYLPGTEWAVLITPQIDKRIAQLLDAFDLEADD